MLPSKYAPGGIDPSKERKVLVLGHNRHKAAHYTIRLIEDRVDNAIRNPQQYQFADDHDIEMVPIMGFDEVNVVTEYVTESRSHGDFSYDDMDLDERYNQTQTVTLDGNRSFLVIDTNFILSHLRILDELKKIGDKYGLRLVVPIAVMQELDGLKGSNRTEWGGEDHLSGRSVGFLARWANDWVYSCLAERVPTVVGQKMNERINKLATKDDAILDCCLYLQKHHTHTLQVLMSNDKNLCMKALLNDVLTVSYRANMSGKLIAEMIQKESIHRFGRIKHDTVVVREVEVPIRQNSARVFPTVYREVEKLVVSVVHRCMASEYGSSLDLLRGYNRDSVRTLKDAADVILRYRIPVFSQYLRQCRNQDIQSMLDVPESKEELVLFIEYWSQMLEITYRQEMDAAQNSALHKLVRRWEDLAAGC